MDASARVVSMWVGRYEAHVTIQGTAGGDLVGRLDEVLDHLLRADARHLVINLHRLTGDDVGVLELLAATCHRLWGRRGVMEVSGLGDRLIISPEVRAFPEIFGRLSGDDDPTDLSR